MLLFLQIEYTTVLDCDFLELRSIRNNFLSPPQRTGDYPTLCLGGATRSCLKLVTNYCTTMPTKFKTGVGCSTFILKLQDHLSEFAPTKTLSFLDSGIKWRDFRPEITVEYLNYISDDFNLLQYEMQSSTGTDNLKNQDTILNVTSGVLYFVGDSLVPDTIDKNCVEGAKVLQQKVLLSYYLTSSSEVVLPIEGSCVSRDGLVLMGESYGNSLFVMLLQPTSLKETNALQKPKERVLHSQKESLLRITLVHPSVSFEIAVIESEDDLLCIHASPTPLPLLSGRDIYTVKVYRPKLMDKRCEENKKSFSPPFYQGKNKFFAMSESSRNNSIRTVHDVPLVPEAICWELPQQSSHQCDQSSTPSCGDGAKCEKETCLHLNSKLQAQGECTRTHDGESEEGKPFLPFVPDLNKSCIFLVHRNIQERGVRMDSNRIVHAKSKEEERISNEDDLISPTPLPLLSSGLVIHLSSFNKLNARDGSFKLSRNISGPDVYTVKIDAGNRGKMDELIRKTKSRALHFNKARIKTRIVRRLQHSAEDNCWELSTAVIPFRYLRNQIA
ncbi:hypothetical protein H5410_009862 [Solanum commersonii]|uniref:Uncharacterized protein n=1 Tax=Solanum commersonii TaxID=4109 RepID=A0A9J6AJY6_SOLCO|nr:hypothetical protein H5410_009862 [Solanum commersonii]